MSSDGGDDVLAQLQAQDANQSMEDDLDIQE